MPGYADSHLHLLSLARALCEPDLGPTTCPSIADMLQAVRHASASTSRTPWLVMRGFDDMLARERRLPRRSELDAVCPAPLRIRHRTGHASLLNSAAFARLPEMPLSARIEPDDSGTPVMLIGAEPWLNGCTGRPRRADLIEGLTRVARLCRSVGIDRVWDATPRDAQSAGELKGLLDECGFPLEARWMQDPLASHATGTHVKLFPQRIGRQLGAAVLSAHARDIPVAIHVAGEEELEAALHALESSTGCSGRDRLEHVPLATGAQARRIASRGATVVTHPGWLVSRRDKYRATLTGEQRARLFPFRLLIECGVELAFSSDAPVELPDPAAWQQIATGRDDGQAMSAQQAHAAACGGSLWDAPAGKESPPWIRPRDEPLRSPASSLQPVHAAKSPITPANAA